MWYTSYSSGGSTSSTCAPSSIRRRTSAVCALGHGRSGSSLLQTASLRQDLALAEAEEAFLVRPDLVDVDVLEPGARVLLKAVQVPLRIRPDGDRCRDVFGPHGLGRRLEIR